MTMLFLCGLGVPSTLLRTCFARDIPSFGCGVAALDSLWLIVLSLFFCASW